MDWTFTDITQELADAFFGGSTAVAGLVIYTAVIAIILAATKNRVAAVVMMLPVSILFNVMGILGTDVTIITLVVAVLMLAVNSYAKRRKSRWQAVHWAVWTTTSRTR